MCTPKTSAWAELKWFRIEAHPMPKPSRKTKDVLVIAAPRQFASIAEEL